MSILKLSDIRTKLPFNINHGLSWLTVNEILQYPEELKIDFDVFLPGKGKKLQRDFVWTLLQKQELILSMLKGIEIPAMAVIQFKPEKNTNVRIYQIIDGKQRLSTMLSFVQGEFAIEYNGVEYFYKDLDSWAQAAVGQHWIKADVGYEYYDRLISEDNKIKWFELINFAGTPQDIEHLNNLKK